MTDVNETASDSVLPAAPVDYVDPMDIPFTEPMDTGKIAASDMAATTNDEMAVAHGAMWDAQIAFARATILIADILNSPFGIEDNQLDLLHERARNLERNYNAACSLFAETSKRDEAT